MKMQGERTIEAPREEVWRALNDPDVLRKCIAGCEELVRQDDNSFAARVTARVGPVKATFKGEVTLEDIDEPSSYTIVGDGKGGAAGFARGSAKVSLEENGEATLLNYDVDAKVGGKLAQIGSRLIDQTAKKMADDFFAKFADELSPDLPEAEDGESGEADADDLEDDEIVVETEAASLDTGVTPPPVNDNQQPVEDDAHETSGPDLANPPGQQASSQMRALTWIVAIAAVIAGLYLVRYAVQ